MSERATRKIDILAPEIEVSAPYKLYRANWRAWAAKPYWSLDESAALLCNCDPAFVFDLPDEALSYLNQVKLAIIRMIDLDLMSKAIRPIQMIKLWEAETPHGAPFELKRAVYEFEEDPERSYSALAVKYRRLEKENETLRAELASKKPLDPRERKSLHTLALLLAIEHHQFNPNRKSDAVKNIRSVLAKYSRSLSDDTVRRILADAADTIEYEFPEFISVKS